MSAMWTKEPATRGTVQEDHIRFFSDIQRTLHKELIRKLRLVGAPFHDRGLCGGVASISRCAAHGCAAACAKK
eukprot:scaffold671621_cov57-Prasinocladus_malaysianus.AAC.2